MWGREDAVGTRGTGMEDAGTRGSPCPLQTSATPGTATERRAPRQPPGAGTFRIGTARPSTALTGAGTVPHPALCHNGGLAAPNALREELHSGGTEARGAGAGEEEKSRGRMRGCWARSSRKRGGGRKLTPRVPRRIPPRDPSRRGGEKKGVGVFRASSTASGDLLTLPPPISPREGRSSHRDRRPTPMTPNPLPWDPPISPQHPMMSYGLLPTPPRGSPPPPPVPQHHPPFPFPSPPIPISPPPRWQPFAPLPARSAPRPPAAPFPVPSPPNRCTQRTGGS